MTTGGLEPGKYWMRHPEGEAGGGSTRAQWPDGCSSPAQVLRGHPVYLQHWRVRTRIGKYKLHFCISCLQISFAALLRTHFKTHFRTSTLFILHSLHFLRAVHSFSFIDSLYPTIITPFPLLLTCIHSLYSRLSAHFSRLVPLLSSHVIFTDTASFSTCLATERSPSGPTALVGPRGPQLQTTRSTFGSRRCLLVSSHLQLLPSTLSTPTQQGTHPRCPTTGRFLFSLATGKHCFSHASQFTSLLQVAVCIWLVDWPTLDPESFSCRPI
jgi:hypothetical protein